MNYPQDLQAAFQNIGVAITPRDVEVICRIGADRFLDLKGFHASEENMSSIYIILSEMKQNNK